MVHIFIVNSNAGHEHFSAELGQHLAYRKDIQYYIFHTRKKQNERQLVEQILKLFEDERVRIYSCGGMGTFCNILNGLYNNNDFEVGNVEIAFYPMGLSNDFLKVFTEEQFDKFKNLDALIDGHVKKIDYIRTNKGVSLNTFSVGLDSGFVKKAEELRLTSIFGGMVPYSCALLYSMFLSKPMELEIKIDDKKYEGKFSEVFFGNGGYIGGKLCFERKPDITDGIGTFAIFQNYNFIKMIPAINALVKKKNEKLIRMCEYGHCTKISLRRKDGVPFMINTDGELQEACEEWTAEIVRQGVSFVLPKGVEMND